MRDIIATQVWDGVPKLGCHRKPEIVCSDLQLV